MQWSAGALELSARCVALSLAVQSAELWQLRAAFGAGGIFRPATLARDPGPSLRRFLQARNFASLVILQLGLSLWQLLFPSWGMLALSATQLMVVMRVRGPFNGGSDMLSLLSTTCLGIALGMGPTSLTARAAGGYLVAQVVLSYFLAGLVKLKEPSWREGSALATFARIDKYAVPSAARAALTAPLTARAISWAVLGFECSFPLALLSPGLCAAYLGVGALFHLGNAACFGLNRFLLAWLAVYPLVYEVSRHGPWA